MDFNNLIIKYIFKLSLYNENASIFEFNIIKLIALLYGKYLSLYLFVNLVLSISKRFAGLRLAEDQAEQPKHWDSSWAKLAEMVCPGMVTQDSITKFQTHVLGRTKKKY